MLLDSTVAVVYDRRGSTKGRLVLDILKCSAGVSPDMVSGGGRLPRAHKHTPRGVMQKKCGREPMANSRTGEPVCTRPRRPCSHASLLAVGQVSRLTAKTPHQRRPPARSLRLGRRDASRTFLSSSNHPLIVNMRNSEFVFAGKLEFCFLYAHQKFAKFV